MNQQGKTLKTGATPLRSAAAGLDRSALDRHVLLMHQIMLSDRRRMDIYAQALAAAIAPGDVVVDVGAGTLALSLLALEAGAGHVYAIEADAHLAALAYEIAADNKLTDRVTVLCGDARAVDLPSAADVIVSEMMGNLGPEEEMAEVLCLVADRCLKPGGRMVPARLVTALQAINLNGEGWGVWSETVGGYSLRSVQDHAPQGGQFHFFNNAPELLSQPLPVADSTLGRTGEMPKGRHRLEITEDGLLQAVAVHFTAHFVDGLTLSNFPSYPGSNWAVWIWPLRHTQVRSGDVLHVDIHPPADVRLASDWSLGCQIERSSRRR